MSELYRPLLHFTPRAGWMNDPNGMIHVDGTYHLFFQHDPASISHGPMHWGHATSTDLCAWTEQPVALYPDALGTCFSGSAVRDATGALKLLYTAHRLSEEGRDFQTQCLVHADKSLETFIAHAANPVLDNPGLVAFRDPKVVWHEPTQRWIMAVTLGPEIGFYSSGDLIGWQIESRFGAGQGSHGTGVWECPDLVEMTGPDGNLTWVLIVSVSEDAYASGSGTQYFVGHFDGTHFHNANPSDTVLWLDHGRDFYAPQTFFDAPGAGPLLMAWASNWTYARQTPTTAFRGAMSLPRALRLVDTVDGLRLAQTIPEGVVARFDSCAPASGTFHKRLQLDLSKSKRGAISLFGEAKPHFVFSLQDDGRACLDIRRAERDDMTGFGHAYSLAFNAGNGRVDVDLYVDNGIVELLIADGLVSVTSLYFPADPTGPLAIIGDQSACNQNGCTHG